MNTSQRMLTAFLTPKHRWLRFSLKSFFVITALFCVWLGSRVNDVQQQRRAVAMAQRLGGKIEYDYTHEAMLDPQKRRQSALASIQGGTPVVIEPPGPLWLRLLVGDEYFVKLHRVDFIDKPVTDADLALLKSQKELWCLRLWETQVTNKGMRHLRGLRNLRILDLRNAEVTDAGLVHIGKLKKLQGLGLGDTQVTDAALGHVKQMTELHSLGLSNTRISDNGMASLGGLIELQRLALDGTKVTDAGLIHLTNMRKLKRIELNGTRITDAGLAHLHHLSDLLFLNLNDTHVTESGVQELFRALPKISEIRR